MPRSQQARFEEAGGQRLPLGSINGYIGVRGKQGRRKDKYQGVTPKKKHRTQLFDTAREAAIAFAQLREDVELRMLEPPPKKMPATPVLAPRPKGSRSASTSATFTSHCRLLSRLCGPVPFCHRSKQTSQWRAVLLLRTPMLRQCCSVADALTRMRWLSGVPCRRAREAKSGHIHIYAHMN